jgi:hypothetical protein
MTSEQHAALAPIIMGVVISSLGHLQEAQQCLRRDLQIHIDYAGEILNTKSSVSRVQTALIHAHPEQSSARQKLEKNCGVERVSNGPAADRQWLHQKETSNEN